MIDMGMDSLILLIMMVFVMVMRMAYTDMVGDMEWMWDVI